MSGARHVRETLSSRPTIEGAGVHLNRAFGFAEVPRLDPFLMLDDFRGDEPSQYEAGFPWHPHRGIETITYLIDGEVDHGDSMGNAGVIGAGDVQWMTAGSGIIHQEMPRGDEHGVMGGFQLWANLPRTHKMMDPRYRGVERDAIPEVAGDGARVRVICGQVDQTSGPVHDIVIEPEYLDVTLEPGARWEHPTAVGHTVLAYVFDGDICFGESDPACVGNGTLVVFGDGDRVAAGSGDSGGRFLLLSGRPLGEPVAWRGPIVMNTDEELRTAFAEYHAGTFVKHEAAGG